MRKPRITPVEPPVPIHVPRWLRQAARDEGVEASVFSAGGILAALDPVARSDEPLGQLWRKRLALGAAAAVSRLEGRREGEAELRDALALCRPGDDPGPAGRMLAGWRYLGEQRATNRADWPERLPGFFDLATSEDLMRVLEGDDAGERTLPVRLAAAEAARALRLGPAYRGLALWLADAHLARALGWMCPVPLIAAHLPRSAFRLGEDDDAWLAACCVAWSRAAIAALDLHADLARRAHALRLAAPKLRGKDAQAVVAKLVTEDAQAAQAGARTSDRAARRLFDRLTGLGTVRELTGRSSFRLYGL